ncbi:MAG: PhoPQ-activated pathogenicity-related family protein [Salinibacter sp.]|uniref:PhoPQ-activated pathogenicity-related family protein n=1 Tax=Salinibacter sp. TaxID=2065818 RepID=UPI0035D40264
MTIPECPPSLSGLRTPLVWTLALATGMLLGSCDLLGVSEKSAQRPVLERYVEASTPAYNWESVSETTVDGVECAELRLTSQRWRGMRWRHQLIVAEPPASGSSKHGALIIGGGTQDALREATDPRSGEAPEQCELLAQAAEVSNQAAAFLRQVPNQPLFGGLTEDELISYTFDQFLENPSEDTWPLLLPMTKSAVKAMDALQEYSAENFAERLEKFTVTGASKRGWTTWLTAAMDDRVSALAPMAFDILNMKVQLDHQLKAWGDHSSRISAYTERGLPQVADTPEGEKLFEIVDPYRYRDRVSEPKLIILGTNDSYWPIDALNLYWKELQGEKHAMYLPNEGHGVQNAERVLATVAAFARAAAGEFSFPGIDASYSTGAGGGTLTVTPTKTLGLEPDAVRLWRATSTDRDFRDAEFSARTMPAQDDGRYRANVARPDQGYRALLGEVVYKVQNRTFTLSTRVRILAAEASSSTAPPFSAPGN